MGQAKRRGTLEQRKAEALRRQEEVIEQRRQALLNMTEEERHEQFEKAKKRAMLTSVASMWGVPQVIPKLEKRYEDD